MENDEIKMFGLYTVYVHFSEIDNQPFYVGLGKNDNKCQDKSSRPKQSFDKNSKWFEIAKNGYKIEIISNKLTKNQAYILERELIDTYGKKYNRHGELINPNGKLVNIK
jgi:hypothetical protein